MYRKNIYFYLVNFQMKQNTCRQCLQLQKCSSTPNKTFLAGGNNQSFKSQQIHLINTEQSKNRQLNFKIEKWRNAKPGISLAKIVKLQVIRREEILMRKVLSFILRDSPRCYRRLSLREMYEKPRKPSRKIRFFHDSSGALIAFYNSKYFKIISWSQIHEISKKVISAKLILQNPLKSRIKLYISKYRRRIPALRSYFARRINVLRNHQILENISSRQYPKNNSINKSLIVTNVEKVNSLESSNILNFSILPEKYKFARPDRNKLESLMAFYFTKFQEGIPAISDYFSKFSDNHWRGDIVKKNKLNQDIDIRKLYDKRKESIFNETGGDKLKIQSSIQGSESLNETNDLKTTLKNDIETIEKLLSVQKAAVNLSRGNSESEILKNYQFKNADDDLNRKISEIEKYDSILQELNKLNTQMNKENSWKERGEYLKDDVIDVSSSGKQSELGDFPDDIIKSYRKLKGNYLSLDLIDNALMLTTPVDPENVQSMECSNDLNETEPNNAKFLDAREDSYKETSGPTKNLFLEDIKEDFDSSITWNQIDKPKARKTKREMRTHGTDENLEEIQKNSNITDAQFPLGEISSGIKSRLVSKNICDNRIEHRKGFEFDIEKSTSSYLRINENKQFSQFSSNLFRKKGNPTEVEKGIGGNELNLSGSHRLGDYPESRSAVRDFKKQFSVSKLLGCDRPLNLNHKIPSHSNVLKNNMFPKKKTASELMKQPNSIKQMQKLLLSNNERSKYHTHSDHATQKVDSEENSVNRISSVLKASLHELKVATDPMLEENDKHISLEALMTSSRMEDINKKQEKQNKESSNEMTYEQKVFKDMVEANNNPFLEFFSEFQQKLVFPQNEYKAVDFKSLQLNSIGNHHTSLIKVLNENSIKTPENDSDLPHIEKYASKDSIRKEDLNDTSLDKNLVEMSTSRNIPDSTKYYKNEFDLKCRFDFPPELEMDNIKTEKTADENSKPMDINPSTSFDFNQKELDKKDWKLPTDFKVCPIQNKEIINENIEHRNIYQITTCRVNKFDKKINFECQPPLQSYFHENENILVEPKNMKEERIKYHNNDFNENSRFDLLPEMGTNGLKSEKLSTGNTGLQNINKTEKYFKNEFDYKCRFDFLPDMESKPLEKETSLTENTKHINSSRKFSDLVMKLEQMRINNTNWFTQPIELSNNNTYLDEFHLPEQLAGGDSLQNESFKKQLNNNNKTQTKNRFETPDVPQEIVLPSTMKPYFDHEYSKIMDNFKLPDLEKYIDTSEHQNVSKPREKIINNVKELQQEKIEMNDNGQNEIQNNARMEVVFDKRPIRDESLLKMTDKYNKNKNFVISFSKNIQSDKDNDKEMKLSTLVSKKLNIDVFSDFLDKKISESVLLIRDISKTFHDCKGQTVDNTQTSISISNQTIPKTSSSRLNNERELLKNSNFGRFESENVLTDKIIFNNTGFQSNLPTIRGADQDYLFDESPKLLLEINEKTSDSTRGMIFDQKFDNVPVESKSLITDETKDSSKENKWFLSAANNLELDETNIHCNRFEENLGGVEDKIYGKVFSREKGKIGQISSSGVTVGGNQQSKKSQQDHYFMTQRINTMTFVNSDIISDGKKYETLEEDCRSIVGERRGLFIEDENDKCFMNNESTTSGQLNHNTNIYYSKHVKELEDAFFTRNVGANMLLDPKVNKQYKGLNLSENVNEYGNPQLNNTVSDESFSKIINDHRDNYDYIYSNIFVNSKFDVGENLLKEPKVHRMSRTKNHRASRNQGTAVIKNNVKYIDKTNSSGKNFGENLETTKEKAEIVDHQEIHRNLELAKLDRLQKVLNDLEEIVGSLSEKVENKIKFPKDGKSNIDYQEHKMMLRDINDSIISSLVNKHIFKGNYNKLKLERHFKKLIDVGDNSRDEGQPSSTKQYKIKGSHLGRCKSVMKEDTNSKYGEIVFECEDYAMQQNNSIISLSGSSCKLLEMNDVETTRSKKIVDRFYKYRHRSFLTHLSKIPEESDSEKSQIENGRGNPFTNASTRNSLNVLDSSTTFAGSLKPQLNPEYVRKVLKQLCTRSVVEEMLQKIEEASERNENVLYIE
ncbi:hypothetical protein LSTR_LSTR000426 [Laodelphax striatellus]|uniref:Uncharacterized protein n=1 Tax=Laodelphax striatellus TaxID=195883 RepID=A0A482X425_LAOST|nr:hypothetical protein LSTR_LSTR000426 [Laodelphax striatellus]